MAINNGKKFMLDVGIFAAIFNSGFHRQQLDGIVAAYTSFAGVSSSPAASLSEMR
jgi:hypothetical protein